MQMKVTVAVVLGLLVIGAISAIWFQHGKEPPSDRQAATVEVLPSTSPAVELRPTGPGEPAASQAKLEPASRAAPFSLHDRIQQRLTALAEAYNAGDAAAAERALDENHAVIRPDGRTLYRSDVLGQWATEWTQFRNRALAMKLESADQEGGRVNARWSVDLKATVLGEDGEEHDFEFSGTQLALYRVDGERLILEEPIRYARVYQAIDGYAVSPNQ